ncbi:lipase family protein [Roseiconus lacunae]|uniref:Lipase family protein n=2 Tax=Roseiconus lacunae TaxID=2605694 RepID=A0ABT7PNR2_9BACT|nr:lipase family protein [Roseiconus lacunae]MDM4018110.1 lipase family protein [Roseiconus lacunae]
MLTCQASYYANPSTFIDIAFWADSRYRDDLVISLHQTGVATGMRRWGFNKVEMFYDRTFLTDTRGFIAYSDDTVVVSFSGSEFSDGFVDWWGTDANVLLVDGSDYGVAGRVHMGFAMSAETVYAQILARVDAASKAGKRVLITGHSLGGAVATLTASRLERDGVDVAALYAFANPLVGDAEFCLDLASSGITCVRTYNHLDPVPRYPINLSVIPYLASLVRDYVHVPSMEVYFDSEMNAVLCPSQERLEDELYFLTAVDPRAHDTALYLLLTYANLSSQAIAVVPTPDI